jgi:hypothetical protein
VPLAPAGPGAELLTGHLEPQPPLLVGIGGGATFFWEGDWAWVVFLSTA